jgi:hypothetical protein
MVFIIGIFFKRHCGNVFHGPLLITMYILILYNRWIQSLYFFIYIFLLLIMILFNIRWNIWITLSIMNRRWHISISISYMNQISCWFLLNTVQTCSVADNVLLLRFFTIFIYNIQILVLLLVIIVRLVQLCLRIYLVHSSSFFLFHLLSYDCFVFIN